MNVTVELLPKSQAALTIEVSVEEVQPYVERAAQQISKEVSVKGFRKGKVPMDVLKQNVGEQAIWEEAFSLVVQELYPKAVEQQKLRAIGRGSIETVKLAPGNPIIFKATVPLMPKVTLGKYQKLKAKKKVVELDQKKYERTLEDLRRMRAVEKLVTRAAQNGDKVLIDFDVKVDGVSIEGGQGTKQSMLIGEGRFIPGFEEYIVGMKKDEEKDFDTTFPKEYFKKDLAGKKAQVHVKLHDVYEVTLPELTDEFAKEMNFESATQLQEEIKKNIVRELEESAQGDFERAVIDEVVQKSTCEPIPDQIIIEEVENMLAEQRHRLQQQGLNFEDYLQHLKKTEDVFRDELKGAAEKRIVAALVMRELSVAEKIEVDAKDIAKEIEEMKKAYATVPEALQQLDSPTHRDRVANMLMHRKTMKKLEEYTK